MKSLIKERKIALFFVTLYLLNLLYLLSTFYSIYGVNDDYLIDTMLRGSYNSTDKHNVTYIHEILGYAIVLLYRIFPIFPIFSLLLLIFFVTAMIGVYVLAVKNNRVNLLILSISWLISSIFITNWFVLNPTFTAVSILLSSFGYFYIFIILKSGSRIKPLTFLIPIIVLFFGYMLRSKGFLSASLVWMPAIIAVLLFKTSNNKTISSKKFNLKYLFLVSPILIIVFSNLFTSQDWKNYYAYNNLRQELANTTRTIYIQQNIEKSNWDHDEFILFDNYTFADQDAFSKSQLEFLVELSSSSQGAQGLLNPVVNVEDRLLNLKRYIGLILTFLILPIGLLLVNSRKNYSNYVFFGIIVGSTFFALYYILATGKIEERVIIPVILNIWFIIFALPPKSLETFKSFRVFVSLFIFSLFLYNFQNHIHEPTYFKERSKWNKRAILFAKQQQNFLENFGSDSIFIGSLSSIRSSWTSPYRSTAIKDLNFVSLGWHNFSPSWISHNKKQFNNELDVYENLLRNPKAYWISDPDSSEYFFNYLRKNYNNDLSPLIVASFGDANNDYGGVYNVYSLIIK